MFGKLSSKRIALQSQFIEHIKNYADVDSDVSKWPLIIKTKAIGLSLAIYLFPNTNPPGGRGPGEYKFNLKVPGQKQGERSDFDYSLGIPILISYTKSYDVYIIYDARMHSNFLWSSNVQSKQQLIFQACIEGFAIGYKKNQEKLIAVTSNNLAKGINEYLKS